MSTNPLDLQAIFDRIEVGKRLSGQDLQILVAAVRSQQVTIATGDRSVAIGGSADGSLIMMGDRNIVITGADADAIRALIGTRPRNEQLLLKIVKDEVESRLKQSLHNAVLINLGMESQPNQIQHPWSSDIKIGDKPRELIPENWHIERVFDEVQGKLLILGNPGSGKTTTMLELARMLLVRAKQDANFPIPILLNLSTWQSSNGRVNSPSLLVDSSIVTWLLKEVKSKYGVQTDIIKKWVEERQFLPLLDGLDELESLRQEPCVMAINALLESEVSPMAMVVCSRAEEYSNYAVRLQLHGAIYLHDLDNGKVQNYLTGVKRGDLLKTLRQNSALLELIRTPFWLSILVLTEHNLEVRDWLALESMEQRLEWEHNTFAMSINTYGEAIDN
jgi:predicted NACHT family NTPase